jgi:PadR family transcriptional regulator PadR
MASETKLSHTAAMILQALDAGFVYGFSIMEMTGLPSGTVYPAMKYYELTKAGKATLQASRKRYPLLERLIPSEEAKSV